MFQQLFRERRARIRAIEQKMLRLAELQFQKSMKRAVGNMQADLDTMTKNQKDNEQVQTNMILQLGARVQLLLDQSICSPRHETIQLPEPPLLLSVEIPSSTKPLSNLEIAAPKITSQPLSLAEENGYPSSLTWPVTKQPGKHFQVGRSALPPAHRGNVWP